MTHATQTAYSYTYFGTDTGRKILVRLGEATALGAGIGVPLYLVLDGIRKDFSGRVQHAKSQSQGLEAELARFELKEEVSLQDVGNIVYAIKEFHKDFPAGMEVAQGLNALRNVAARTGDLPKSREVLQDIAAKMNTYEKKALQQFTGDKKATSEIRQKFADARSFLNDYLAKENFTIGEANPASHVVYDLGGGLAIIVGTNQPSVEQWVTGAQLAISQDLQRDYRLLSNTSETEANKLPVIGARESIEGYKTSIPVRTEAYVQNLKDQMRLSMYDAATPFVLVAAAIAAARLAAGSIATRLGRRKARRAQTQIEEPVVV